MRWDKLCKRFAEHGLTDNRGVQATPETARKTWLRVRRFVAQARAPVKRDIVACVYAVAEAEATMSKLSA